MNIRPLLLCVLCILLFNLLARCRARQESPLHRHRRHAVRRDRKGRDAATSTRLMKDGIHSPTCLILGDRYQKNDTISGPGWSSILTGVWADKHGVHDNSFNGHALRGVPALLRPAEGSPPGRQDRLASSPGSRSTSKITSAADVSINYEQKDHGILDYDRYDTAGHRRSRQAARPKAIPTRCSSTSARSMWPATPTAFIRRVPQYIAAIERADKLVGRAVAAVKARKTYADEDWLVIVTSDHGGKGTGHGGGHTHARNPQQLPHRQRPLRPARHIRRAGLSRRCARHRPGPPRRQGQGRVEARRPSRSG